jgi:putative ABC transport system ATP-binding protein
MGPSGSGKSTLLHLLGGLDRPEGGEVALDGAPLSSLSDDARTRLRRDRIGIVYQFFNLVPVLTVTENICLPAVISGQRQSEYASRLEEILKLVGLSEDRNKQPSQLSGGQQQRAAIARALFIEPAVLLADEPTGNLDIRTGADILSLFSDAQRRLGQTIVMVTHDPRSAAYGDEVVLLRAGKVAGHLDLTQKCRGEAKANPAHPARSRAVLRWLEQFGDED